MRGDPTAGPEEDGSAAARRWPGRTEIPQVFDVRSLRPSGRGEGPEEGPGRGFRCGPSSLPGLTGTSHLPWLVLESCLLLS
ncbi:hypothetical protein NN561_019796 [Cricetulus griseus]